MEVVVQMTYVKPLNFNTQDLTIDADVFLKYYYLSSIQIDILAYFILI